MKKVLSVLSLIVLFGLASPVMAAPGGHGGPGGPGMHDVHRGGRHHMAAPHHRPPRHHVRHHGGITFHSSYPRHSYWYGYGPSYWGGSRCNPRLGWYTDCYYPPYVPVPGASFSIRF